MDRAEEPTTRIVAIVGPTAAGKEALGLRAAEALSLPILVCDSVKVYRGLDIGSAKPSAAMRAAVPHRLIDLVDPDHTFSAGDYARAALAELSGERGLFVGGTGFYLRAVAMTPTEVPAADRPPDDPIRAAFEARWRAAEAADPGALHRALSAVDPPSAESIHPHNAVRLLRALWLCEVCGGPVSALRRRDPQRRRVRLMLVVLDPGVAEVDARIEARVDAMLAAGWVAEVEKLLHRGYDGRHKAMQSLGYRQLIDVVQGRMRLPEAREAIVTATRQYARRQRTYFRSRSGGGQLVADETIALTDASACPWPQLHAFLRGER